MARSVAIRRRGPVPVESMAVSRPANPADDAANGVVEVSVERMVAGGVGLGHDVDGTVVLVSGALPGERVVATVGRRTRRLVQAATSAVVAASPHRVDPPCPHLADGCGGCDLQFCQPAALAGYKCDVVADALAHLGRVAGPTVEPGPPLPPWGFRTTVRAAVDATGRAGLRRARSHEPVAVDHCAVAHPLVDEVLATGRFPGATEVTIRASASTGERLVVVVPGAGRPDEVLAAVEVPASVAVAGPDGRGRDGQPVAIHEDVADRLWRVSAGSFFQTRPDGARVLADTVVDAVTAVGRDGAVVDLYSGVGLFAGVLRTAGWSGAITAVERSASSVADAVHNLSGDDVSVVAGDVDRWGPQPASVVVADPARSGLGARAAGVVAATGATTVVLVSCDAAALGRDVSLLGGHGFVHRRSVVVDLFAHTHHVEVVTTLTR